MQRCLVWVGAVVLGTVACGSSGSGSSGLGSGGSAAGGSGGNAAGGSGGSAAGGSGGTGGVTPPLAACEPVVGGVATVPVPTLLTELADRWEEGWLASPAVADLDGDGSNEIIVARGEALVVWRPDGSVAWKFEGLPGRIWASPVVADLSGAPGLEVAVASRDQVFLLSADGQVEPGFPVTWEDELRALAAGDLDGNGNLDLAVSTGHSGPSDVIMAWDAAGQPLPGFPPNATGSSGCGAGADANCYLAGCYDQNLALGDIDGDDALDVVAPHDNAYASFHRGDGFAFDAAAGFASTKTPGVRYLHALAEAQQGWAEDEATALQAHFTNTAPALADVDGDGTRDVVLLASVQNAAQDSREQGVALWVVRSDASRLPAFETPVHAPGYRSGLWDYGDNVVATTNQASVADLDPDRPGLEVVFAGFDGAIHGVAANGEVLFRHAFATSDEETTGGVVVGDLSGDGTPELVFTTYSLTPGEGALVVLDAGGNALHRLALPGRGAMPVPTLADVDGDGSVEIVVSLKDAEDRVRSVQVYALPGTRAGCLPWPTGRANLLRSGAP